MTCDFYIYENKTCFRGNYHEKEKWKNVQLPQIGSLTSSTTSVTRHKIGSFGKKINIKLKFL